MEGFETVVFKEKTRVTVGAHIAWFQANTPRLVNRVIADEAIRQGAEVYTVPKPKAPPKRAYKPVVDEELKKRSPAPRKKRKKRPDSTVIADAVEFMTEAQPSWTKEQYDLNKLPRMTLFKEAVPDLTPTLREAAWDIFISGQRDA